MPNHIRCLAVDGHPCLLAGMSGVFEAAGDIELVGHTTRLEDVLDLAPVHTPDVAILDNRVNGTSATAVLERLREVSPATVVLVYSSRCDRRLLTELLDAGVRGYVLKASPVEDLLRAVRTVANGEAYVDPALSPILLMDPHGPGSPLPEREREILQLLAEGLNTDDVARRIGLSAETVKSETRRAVQRLGARGRVDAVAIAVRRSDIT